MRTLGELAKLPAGAVADRFVVSLGALRLAGRRRAAASPASHLEQLVERIRLPEAASAAAPEHALSLLVERLLARPARAGRTIRALRLEAGLAAGGGWRSEVAALRSASASAERLLLAIVPRLGEPRPGLPAGVAGARASGPRSASRRHWRTRRGTGGAAGWPRRFTKCGRRPDVSLLRVVGIDPGSRVPERRAILTPWSADDG